MAVFYSLKLLALCPSSWERERELSGERQLERIDLGAFGSSDGSDVPLG